jgi:hypothetical protein
VTGGEEREIRGKKHAVNSGHLVSCSCMQAAPTNSKLFQPTAGETEGSYLVANYPSNWKMEANIQVSL